MTVSCCDEHQNVHRQCFVPIQLGAYQEHEEVDFLRHGITLKSMSFKQKWGFFSEQAFCKPLNSHKSLNENEEQKKAKTSVLIEREKNPFNFPTTDRLDKNQYFNCSCLIKELNTQ